VVGKHAQRNRVGIERGAPFRRPLKRVQNALLDVSHGVKDRASALTRRLSRSTQFEVPPAFVLPQSSNASAVAAHFVRLVLTSWKIPTVTPTMEAPVKASATPTNMAASGSPMTGMLVSDFPPRMRMTVAL